MESSGVQISRLRLTFYNFFCLNYKERKKDGHRNVSVEVIFSSQDQNRFLIKPKFCVGAAFFGFCIGGFNEELSTDSRFAWKPSCFEGCRENQVAAF